MKKFRCRLMLLAMCAEAWTDVEINATNFPDEAFRNYVSSKMVLTCIQKITL